MGFSSSSLRMLVYSAIFFVSFCSTVYADQLPVEYSQRVYQEKIHNSLVKMESDAEAMLAAVNGKRLKRMEKFYARLSKEMLALNKFNHLTRTSAPRMQGLIMQNAWFDLITIEYNEADDMPALENAINQFTGQLIVSINFGSEYKIEIAWMNYLGREIFLLSTNRGRLGNPALLDIRKQNLHKTWSNLRLEMLKRKGGSLLVKKTDVVIQHIMLTRKPKKLVKLATKELKLVGGIKKFFHINSF